MHKVLRYQYTLLTISVLTLYIGLTSTVFSKNNDALAPKSSVQDALAKPLHTVTIATVSLEQYLLFYRDGMGMKVEGPLETNPALEKAQRALWQMPDDVSWQTYRFYRHGINESIQIRLLVLNKPMPTIHDSWDPRELGPFSLGFPNSDTAALDKHIRKIGFGSLNSLESYPIPRTDGTTYQIDETIFNAPDFVHGVAITRGNGMPQLGPLDEHGQGGPAYSAQVITHSDTELAFYTDVLGLEIRSDRVFKSAGDKGAMNLPNGTEFRFAIVYSKGATTGHMLFVDYYNIDPIVPTNTPTLPNMGIGMWTFEVTSLAQVLTNARSLGANIVTQPMHLTDPVLGSIKVATLRAPNGFLIEVFEVE